MRLFTVMLGMVTLSGVANAVTLTSRSGTQTAAVIELAPLRGLVGQPSARGEALVTPRVAIGGGYEAWSSESERPDFTDRHTAMQMEGLFYPLGIGSYPVFIGAGLRLEQAELGRQATRGATTWARTTADDRYDRWVNRDSYYSVTESVGYRLVTNSIFTGAVRFQRDELVHQTSSEDPDGVISSSPDMTTKGRPKVRHQIAFFAGLMLR